MLEWDEVHFLRSLPRGEFLCEALHHWSANGNSGKLSPLVKMSSNIIERSSASSDPVEGEKFLGEWILFLPFHLPGFSLHVNGNLTPACTDAIGVRGVSWYWGNAVHVPGQVLLAFTNQLKPKKCRHCSFLKSKVLGFWSQPTDQTLQAEIMKHYSHSGKIHLCKIICW